MSCNNCNTCEVSEKRGCGTSSVFDWLNQVDAQSEEYKSLVEVQFKGDRKEFYVNTEKITLSKGDWVAVQGEKSGHDIGWVTMQGEIVFLQIQRKTKGLKIKDLKKIYRKASSKDLEKMQEAHKKENNVLEKAKRIVEKHKTEMNLSDVEFQGDGSKATFYYTAEKRVDFRNLIREYSKEFNIRIEMRQIGVRQEAAKIGGIGSCGRELCCSTWMTEFPPVSTKAARYQQLSINPQKISGQCGRLKCCLNFELDSYTEALKKFPNQKTKLKFKKGIARAFKIDIFREKISYFYIDNPSEIIEINVDAANTIIELNKKQKTPEKIEDYITKKGKKTSFKDVVGQDDINRFDNNKKRKKP